HLDLLLTVGGEHDRELGLLLDRRRRGRAWSRGHRHRRRGGDAPLLLQHLRQIGGLQNRELGEVVDEFLQISHWTSLSFRTSRVCGAPHAASPVLAKAWTTRASLAAGALTTCAILVAGA